MDRLERWSAIAAALCSAIATLCLGIPAYMNYGRVTSNDWHASLALFVCAATFFATSVITAVVGGVRRRRENRRNGV